MDPTLRQTFQIGPVRLFGTEVFLNGRDGHSIAWMPAWLCLNNLLGYGINWIYGSNWKYFLLRRMIKDERDFRVEIVEIQLLYKVKGCPFCGQVQFCIFPRFCGSCFFPVSWTTLPPYLLIPSQAPLSLYLHKALCLYFLMAKCRDPLRALFRTSIL